MNSLIFLQNSECRAGYAQYTTVYAQQKVAGVSAVQVRCCLLNISLFYLDANYRFLHIIFLKSTICIILLVHNLGKSFCSLTVKKTYVLWHWFHPPHSHAINPYIYLYSMECDFYKSFLNILMHFGAMLFLRFLH